MSRRGRLRLGLDPCVDRVEKIAELHAAGLGTTEIQARLGGRRSTISRVRAVLRAAEQRGRDSVGKDAGAPESAAQPFPKYPESGS